MRSILIDLETGGFNPKEHAITEIGAVAFEAREDRLVIVDTFECLVRPPSKLSVSEEAARVQGRTIAQIYDREEQLSEYVAGARLSEFLDSQTELNALEISPLNPVMEPHNLKIWANYSVFDNGFLLALHDREPTVRLSRYFVDRNQMCCVRELAKMMQALGRIAPGSVSLDSLLERFGFYHERAARQTRHSALGDTRVTLQVLERLFKLAGWLPI